MKQEDTLWLVTELMDADVLSVLSQLNGPSKMRITLEVAKVSSSLLLLHRQAHPTPPLGTFADCVIRVSLTFCCHTL